MVSGLFWSKWLRGPCMCECRGVPIMIMLTKWHPIKYLHLKIDIHKISLNPFRPEFTIVIFIHYKPRIAVAILDL